MKLRPYVVITLVRKDIARLLRNGPALMLLGLFVLVALLTASSGLVDTDTPAPAVSQPSAEAWIVYTEDNEWVQNLRRRAPPELGIRFVDGSTVTEGAYPPNICVIELHAPVIDQGRQQVRQHVRYRYPGSDPDALWPLGRWFLSVSLEHFGRVPQFFETIQPLTPPSREEQTRAALENVSVADILSPSMIGTALLTTIQFFAACGLLVSLTAQERERGALRALLLTPATYLEFVVSKVLVHGTLALSTSALAMGVLQPAVLSSLLFWATMVAITCGYLGVGLLIASFCKNQAAPNLLSFAYLMSIGALNLLGARFTAFEFLSALTFERYGLVYTLASLANPDITVGVSLAVLLTPDFLTLVCLSTGLLLIASFIGSRTMRRDR